jgi:hypothetical protein
LPKRPRSFALAPWLLLAAALCLLLEVLERRTGLVSSAARAIRPGLLRLRLRRRVPTPAPAWAAETDEAAPAPPSERATKSTPAPAAAKAEATKPENKGGLLDAMRKVRDRNRGG